MTTVKQLERAWSAKQYERLFRDLIACRPEAGLPLQFDAGWAPAAAALALIRMEELTQSHVPFYRQLLTTLLLAQQADGGWGDLPTTALCLRALLNGEGHGLAIERGMAFLANLQKPEGLWPTFPLRRLPEDACVSAFIVYELGDQAPFQSAVRMDELLAWFEANEPFLDQAVRDLWRRAARRCHAPGRGMQLSWS
jgi:hypothetical protein